MARLYHVAKTKLQELEDCPMVKTHRRYQEIAGRISRYIAENRLEPGARLPGEIDLAKVCVVSRPTIREAMVALEIAGELEIRSGSGAYVREAVNPMSLVLDSGPGPFELLRARILIEGSRTGVEHQRHRVHR